jgi:dTMP kinase
MNLRPGLFVVVEGPSGVGKSTIVQLVRAELELRGIPVVATKEPSNSALGELARHETNQYRGLVLACLVAADRYHHLEHEIEPALGAGHVVICDRYVPTSLVLQRIDGVQPDFLANLNQYAQKPNLTVVLTGKPELLVERTINRGTYSRFHRGGLAARKIEDQLYREVAKQLRETGSRVLHYEVADTSADAVAAIVLEAVIEQLER